MDRWDLAWLVIIAAATVLDIVAARNHRSGDTLSEHIWAFLGIGRTLSLGVRLRRIVFLAFWCWATVHLLTHWV